MSQFIQFNVGSTVSPDMPSEAPSRTIANPAEGYLVDQVRDVIERIEALNIQQDGFEVVISVVAIHATEDDNQPLTIKAFFWAQVEYNPLGERYIDPDTRKKISVISGFYGLCLTSLADRSASKVCLQKASFEDVFRDPNFHRYMEKSRERRWSQTEAQKRDAENLSKDGVAADMNQDTGVALEPACNGQDGEIDFD